MFPIFDEKKDHKRLVYLDTGATSQRPKIMIDAVHDFYTNRNASVHRGVYELSEWATEKYEEVRGKAAKYLNAADSSEIIFTSGTTDGINFVADAWALDHINEGDEIVTTQIEHHANLLPWQRVAKKRGAKLRFIELDKDTFLLKQPESDLINNKTKLVALIHTSNVLGNVWEKGVLESIIEQAHKVGAKVLLDGAQSAPHKKIDLQKLQADFFAFSAHKMCGPMGLGVLYIKKDLHDEVEPYRVGGSMVHDVWLEKAEWADPPQKFEAGTPPVAQVVGFDKTIDFFNEQINFDALHKHEAEMCNKLVDELCKIEKVSIFGNQKVIKQSGHLVAFTVDGIHSHDIAAMLAMNGVAVRAGHHCALPLAKIFCIDASVRASFYMYNEMEDTEILVRSLKEIIKNF
jgi:cysteine desulfurase/selenocysteine lyase